MKRYLVILAIGLSYSFSAFSDSHQDKKESKQAKKVEKKLSKIDINHDGKISLEEHINYSTERFKKMDADNDGVITRKDIRSKKRQHKSIKKQFKIIDSNDDNQISLQEHLSFSRNRFNATDINNDQIITQAETLKTHTKKIMHTKKRFEKLDTNKDGKIDLNEQMTHATKYFEKTDLNDDNVITKKEIKKAHKKDKKMAKKQRKKMKKMFKRADANEDKEISLKEHTNFATKRFQHIDKNNDGFITPQEAISAHKR